MLAEAEQEAEARARKLAPGRADDAMLKGLIERHRAHRQRARARSSTHWAQYRAKFVKVFPNEYRRALGRARPQKHKRRAA